MENKKKMDRRGNVRNPRSRIQNAIHADCTGANNTILNDTIMSSSSDSTISSTGATITKTKRIPKTQLFQEKMDLQYNKYLRIKLMHKLTNKFHTIQKNNIYNQAYVLVEIKKKLLHLKFSAQIQNKQMEISEQLKYLVDENSKYLNKMIDMLADNSDIYKCMLNDLKIYASKVSLKNIDITDYDNTKFMNLLQAIYNSLKLLSTSDKTNQIIELNELFEQFEQYNEQLQLNFNECSDTCANTARNVIIATATQLMNTQDQQNI